MTSDREELDRAYNARASVSADAFRAVTDECRTSSDLARLGRGAVLNIVYDSESGQKLDLYGVERSMELRPAVLYIHGGYWRALSRFDSAFMAPALAATGCVTAVPDYRLAPDVRLEEIVREVRAGLAWLWHNGAAYGVDRNRIVACGSSAGGHLTASLAAGGWQQAFGLPEQALHGAMPVSGLFDLLPISRAFPQDFLHLTQGDVQRLSPIRNLPLMPCPMVVAIGEHEPDGFIKQSREFYQAWRIGQPRTVHLVIAGRNHFDVVLDLKNPESVLSIALSNLLA